MKVYHGRREKDGCVVTVDGAPLDPRLDLRGVSATGFEWGYEGGGPSRLALAILADHFGDDAKALDLHRSFRASTIAVIHNDEWTLNSSQIDGSLKSFTEVPLTLKELLNKVRGTD